MFSWKTIMHNGRDTIAAFIKDLWIYMRNKPKWQLFLELLLSVIISWIWMWALLIFLAEYDPRSGAGASIDGQIIAYGWTFALHSIILSLSFLFFGRKQLLASIITTTTYLLIPLLVWIVGFCISIIFLFLNFSQDALFVFICTWLAACITLWLFYTFVNKKEQYSLLLGDREGSSSDLIQFWSKNYIFFLFHIGLVAAFVFFLYASWFMRDS